MKVGILESLGITETELKNHMEPLEKMGVEFSIFNRETNLEILKEEIKGLDAVIVANMPFNDEVIASSDKLSFIDVAFTGVDHIGLNAAKEKGIKVSNASGYSTEAVAEWVIGTTLSLYRYLRETEALCRASSTKGSYIGYEIKGKTVGIVGLGNIGKRVAELFHAFGADVLAYSRHIKEDAPEYVKQVSLEELLKESDIVTLHCPINDDSRGLINKDTLALMKEDAILLNASRGPVVVTEDLQQALASGKIKSAALDVFENEPPLANDYPLFDNTNILLTPHIGFATKEAMRIRADIVFDNLKAYIEGNQKNIIL